jgi:predicted dehydrogenase
MQIKTTRREVIKSATLAAAASALSMTAASYARVAGANDRISIGMIGCGERGTGAHLPGIGKHIASQNFIVTAVADPWRVSREHAAELIKEQYGEAPRKFASYREVLALADVDAFMIASPDHHHPTHLQAVAEAKKDVYCEKPLSNDLEKLKNAVDAVKKSGVVCQIGTQLRSIPVMGGCRKVYQSGILGTVARVEQVRNGTQPYWYRYAQREVKEADVDWKEFLGDTPAQAFDPLKYAGWFGYREFCDGPVPQLGVHFLDLVHYITGATFPKSCVCMGNTFTWKDKYKFTTPDQVQALWEYPQGFMVSYSSNFGNASGDMFKIFGDQGILDITKWTEPVLSADGGSKNRGIIRGKKPVEDVPCPDHFLNWLQCLRDRKTPNASIDAGYQHAVASIMSVRAMDSGRRQIYDAERREIREG